MQKSRIVLSVLVAVMIVGTTFAALASKARLVYTYYRPPAHLMGCTISTILFLTTTDLVVGSPVEIATTQTLDSCVQYVTGSD